MLTKAVAHQWEWGLFGALLAAKACALNALALFRRAPPQACWPPIRAHFSRTATRFLEKTLSIKERCLQAAILCTFTRNFLNTEKNKKFWTFRRFHQEWKHFVFFFFFFFFLQVGKVWDSTCTNEHQPSTPHRYDFTCNRRFLSSVYSLLNKVRRCLLWLHKSLMLRVFLGVPGVSQSVKSAIFTAGFVTYMRKRTQQNNLCQCLFTHNESTNAIPL